MASGRGKEKGNRSNRPAGRAVASTSEMITKRRHRHTATAQSEALPDLSKLTRNQTIDLYHTIQKRLAAVDRNPQFANEAARHARKQILRAQLAVIGLENYQTASREGEKLSAGFDCSKWVLHELRDVTFAASSVKLLDVGAIIKRFPGATTTASGQVAMQVTAIDLHPENSELGSHVIQADLINYAAREDLHATFDVICLSLCVNFEGCPKRRGLMLKSAQVLLKDNGLLFFTLPAACVQNSRYFDEQLLRQVLSACGMQQTKLHFTNKLMLCVSRKAHHAFVAAQLQKRRVLRQGTSRNNFWITIADNTRPRRAGSGREGSCVGHGLTTSSQVARHPSKLIAGATSSSNQRKRARRKASRAQRARTNSSSAEIK
ncbi:25S rRNA (adenine(2142)-N(1))-methyltransferase [Gracilariopsis chorda]|uniref:25S rRNA (Adenine(2142)-N(1))-methyltransferase n=1 Tax=Gracilariopsis chorda TaxID=448386 RepID=A0A2V3J8K1_9FLOR|nr:25S rRNA (adenine(2142)-N(1))-methyltransferase [Gracilariopsis chorda]|eukprot:PXF49410.1 25S rRNA (adenine(2142)-N(1))-methyltransferase [Gracilariopsis chorda]